MSFAIRSSPANEARVTAGLRETTGPKGPGDAVKATKDEEIAKVGAEFEAILVRQLLAQTKVAGKGGYADMAVESLATSISSAGGLGMSRAIRDALSRTHMAPHPEPMPAVDGEEIRSPRLKGLLEPAVRHPAEQDHADR
jgi:hypothetical protein